MAIGNDRYLNSFKEMYVVRIKQKRIKQVLFQKLCHEKTEELGRQLQVEEESEINEEAEDQSKAIDLNRVCLCFQAFIKDDVESKLVSICEPVYSNVITSMIKRNHKRELKIISMEPKRGTTNGGTAVIILVKPIDDGKNYDFKFSNYCKGYFRRRGN